MSAEEVLWSPSPASEPVAARDIDYPNQHFLAHSKKASQQTSMRMLQDCLVVHNSWGLSVAKSLSAQIRAPGVEENREVEVPSLAW
jgi:hypothetical protein